MTTPRPIRKLCARAPAERASSVLALLCFVCLGYLGFATFAVPAAATTTLSDPVGDVIYYGTPPAGLAIPDLTEISGGYTATDLILTATFAPGTLVPGVGNTFFAFGLDLDLDERTGTDFIRGAEKQIMFHTALTHVFVCDRILVFPAECGGQLPVQLGTDFLSITLPLGPDGIDDDGIARFGFVAGMLGDAGPISDDIAFDVTSAVDRRFSVTTSAVPVPEPGTGSMLGLGLFGIAAGRRLAR